MCVRALWLGGFGVGECAAVLFCVVGPPAAADGRAPPRVILSPPSASTPNETSDPLQRIFRRAFVVGLDSVFVCLRNLEEKKRGRRRGD